MQTDTRILILVPSKETKGGIANYYSIMQNKFALPVDYFYRGSRKWPYISSKFN